MSYHTGFLYMSDGYGNPTEVINEARTAANLRRASSTGTVSRFNLIADNANCAALAYQPCNDWSPDYVKNQVTALRDATLWMDPTFSTTNEVGLQNWGTGGEVMNASYPTPGTSPLLLQHTGSNYLYMPGVSGNTVSASLIGDYLITGDITVTARVALDDWTPASDQYFIGRWSGAGQLSWLFGVTTTGFLKFWNTVDGTTQITRQSSVVHGFADKQAYWVKVTLKVDSGLGTNIAKFYYAADQTEEPTSWTQLGTDVSTAGVTSIWAGTAPMETPFNLTGKLFRTIVQSGIDGPRVFDCDFGRLVTGAETSIIERSRHNRTVTINRSTAGRKAVAVVRNTLLFGTNDFLEIPDHTALDGGASSFTVMMAVRQWTTAVNFGRYIDKRDINAPNIGWTLSSNGTTIQAIATADSGANAVTSSGAVFTAGSLTLIGFVIDRSTNTMTTYTNGVAGVAQNLATSAIGDITNALPVRIGAIANAAGGYQDFEMFTTGIWNRALSATEIAEMYTYYNTVPPANSMGGTTGWQLIDTNISGAPWYVTGNTASTEGYGFYIEEWTGLDGVHHARSITPYGPGRGGATFGRQTSAHRTMAINVLLVGASNRGLNHLFRWLESTLLSSCACENPSLWFREYCPDVSSLTDGLARADDVALVGPVQWESPPLEDAGCFVRRASFVLASGSPCLFREPTTGTSFTSTYASWNSVVNPGTAALVTDNLVPLTTWNSTNTCASTVLASPAYGSVAPYITIKSPLENNATGLPKYVPDLRIIGLVNPMDVAPTSFGEMFVQGAFVLTGIEAGMEVIVDLASATIKMRRPHDDLNYYDGSRLIGTRPVWSPSFVGPDSVLRRWFSFESCDEPIVVVEPNAYSDGATTWVSTWTVTIGSQERFGCV